MRHGWHGVRLPRDRATADGTALDGGTNRDHERLGRGEGEGWRGCVLTVVWNNGWKETHTHRHSRDIDPYAYNRVYATVLKQTTSKDQLFVYVRRSFRTVCYESPRLE